MIAYLDMQQLQEPLSNPKRSSKYFTAFVTEETASVKPTTGNSHPLSNQEAVAFLSRYIP